MTLIEAMIAVLILSIVSTVLYSGFVQTSRNKSRVEEETDRYHEVSSALERLVRELSMAYVSAQLNPSPNLQTVSTCFYGEDSGARDRLDFTSFSHQRLVRDAHESDQNELSYFLARSPNDSAHRALVRREQNRVDDDPRHGGSVQVVVDDVKEFELEYFDPVSLQWVDAWHGQQNGLEVNRLPSQVKITLVIPGIRDRNRSLTFGTRALVPIRFGLNHAIYNP